jgi:hypothetical protein
MEAMLRVGDFAELLSWWFSSKVLCRWRVL